MSFTQDHNCLIHLKSRINREIDIDDANSVAMC